MADIVHWLRKLAALVEADHAPQHVVMHMRAGADEIERLRARLEIDPSHPYDGIYARDETIRGLEKEIERLRAGGCARDQGTTQYCAEAAKKDAEIASLLNTLADERTESMRLRARVTELEGQHKGLVLNNAILRERPDLPLNRIPAARAMTKLYEDNERLRADLRLAVMSDGEECEALSHEVERLVKSRNRWGQKYNALLEKHKRLRAALRECLGWHDYSEDMHKPIEVRAAYMRARAALEVK